MTKKANGRPKIKALPPVDPSSHPSEWKGTIPERVIDLEQVLYWTEFQATAEEIAGSFRVSVDTLDRRLKEAFGMGFAELRKRCSGLSKLSLRRNQFNLSKKNATMAIWLGKNWLGQKDIPAELSVSEDTVHHFNALMNQIGKVQSDKSSLNMDESSINKEM